MVSERWAYVRRPLWRHDEEPWFANARPFCPWPPPHVDDRAPNRMAGKWTTAGTYEHGNYIVVLHPGLPA